MHISNFDHNLYLFFKLHQIWSADYNEKWLTLNAEKSVSGHVKMSNLICRFPTESDFTRKLNVEGFSK